MLLYCIGPEVESVLDSTNATEEDRKIYSTVLAKFDSFFKVRKNTIFERAKFNRRRQQEGEFTEALKVLSWPITSQVTSIGRVYSYTDIQSEVFTATSLRYQKPPK